MVQKQPTESEGELRRKIAKCWLCFSQASVFQKEQVKQDEAQRWKRTTKYMQHFYYRAGEAWCIIECDFSLLVEGIISILQVE